jgi:pyridoxamine 5'-phosphate oxidase
MDLNGKLQNLRVNYRASKLDLSDTNENPLTQFDLWLRQAIESDCEEPNAFVLSSISENKPRARVVLLKGILPEGLIFYSNYLSDKGREIKENNSVCMTFLWAPLQRQVRIEGIVSMASAELSDSYFASRPRGSQLGAIASPQSQKVESREKLEELFQNANERFGAQETLTRPIHWGGYVIRPVYAEFWQGRDNRMHDRICYVKEEQTWTRFRLAP